MQNLTFLVKTKKEISKNWSLKSIQKFPVHEDFLFEKQQFKVVYEYNPTKNFTLHEFIEFMSGYLKKIYNAYEVVVINEKNY